MNTKVLVVDDNKDVLNWFVNLFGGAYDITCCENLDDVKDRWSDYSLCVLDHYLANGVTGVDVASWIRTKSDDVPLAWMTSRGDEDVYEMSIALGAVAFIAKPMDHDNVSDVLTRYADSV